MHDCPHGDKGVAIDAKLPVRCGFSCLQPERLMNENMDNQDAMNGEPVPNPAGGRVIVLVGLMGAGKTTVGRRLANRLGVPFVDADAEIEAAAGMTIPEIFAQHGEQHFRAGERKVIARLLQENGGVLATGGGAFMDPDTRAQIKRDGVSVWLRAEVALLLRRVARRNNRPLLKQGDPAEIMTRLRDERYPVYAEADITVDSTDVPHEEIVDAIIAALQRYFSDPERQVDR